MPAAYPDKGCSHAYTMVREFDFCWCSSCNTFWVWKGTDDRIKGWYCIPSPEGHQRFGYRL